MRASVNPMPKRHGAEKRLRIAARRRGRRASRNAAHAPFGAGVTVCGVPAAAGAVWGPGAMRRERRHRPCATFRSGICLTKSDSLLEHFSLPATARASILVEVRSGSRVGGRFGGRPFGSPGSLPGDLAMRSRELGSVVGRTSRERAESRAVSAPSRPVAERTGLHPADADAAAKAVPASDDGALARGETVRPAGLRTLAAKARPERTGAPCPVPDTAERRVGRVQASGALRRYPRRSSVATMRRTARSGARSVVSISMSGFAGGS